MFKRTLSVTLVLAVVGPLASAARADFILWNDEEFTVDTSHAQGTLYDESAAYVVAGGSVSSVYASNSSAVDVSAGLVSGPFPRTAFSALSSDLLWQRNEAALLRSPALSPSGRQ